MLNMLRRRTLPRASCRAVLALAALLSITLLAGLASARERVLVCPFEGIRANQLRWRVSSVVRYAGHTSLKYKAPPANASDERLISYARRRDVDAFVFGTVEQAEDESWTLTLTIKNRDAEIIESGLVYEAPDLGALVKLLKGQGKQDLKVAVTGESVSRPSYEEPPPPISKPKKKKRRRRKRKKRSRKTETEVFDADSYDPAPSAAPTPEPVAEVEKTVADPVGPRPSSDEGSNDDSDETQEDDDEGFSVELGADEDEFSDSGDDESGASSASSLLDLGARAGVVSRELRYVSDLYQRLRSHDTNAVTVQVDARFYPFVEPLADNIALIASYATSVAGQVQDPNSGQDLAVSYSEYTIGARLQAAFGGRYRIGADVTFGGMSSDLDDAPGDPPAPAYEYTLLRSVGFLGMSLGSLHATGSIGYDTPLGYGELAETEFFPRVEGGGVEAGLSLEYRLSRNVGLEASGNFRRFVLNMNSQPADATGGISEVASGVTDVYAIGFVGINFSL